MPNVTVYIRVDDMDAWKALPNKAEAISGILQEKKVEPIFKPITRNTRLTTFKDNVIDVDLPTTFRRDNKLCKVHGTPLANGNCLQKGCKK